MEYKIKKIGDDELYHFGVPGMKWGVRKSKYTNAIKDKRAKEFREHYDRKLKKSIKSDTKLLSGREKHAQKLQKKIEKAQKKANDFDEFTKSLKKGMDVYNSIIENRRDTKISAIYDKKYKKSFAYKNAAVNYIRQILKNDYYRGDLGTKLFYTDKINKKQDPKL